MSLAMDSDMRDERKSEILSLNYHYCPSSGHLPKMRSFYTKIHPSNTDKVQTTGTILQVGGIIYPLDIII